MQRILIGLAGFYGFASVAMAALATHLLAPRLDAAAMAIVRTGIDIAAWHALALLALGLSGARLGRWGQAAGALWAVGTLLFSVAVFWRGIAGGTLDGVAPAGGVSLMAGWLVLLAAAVRGA